MENFKLTLAGYKILVVHILMHVHKWGRSSEKSQSCTFCAREEVSGQENLSSYKCMASELNLGDVLTGVLYTLSELS